MVRLGPLPLQAIIDNPAGYYVNIHTADFGPGAIRGQLKVLPPNTAMLQAPTPLAPLSLAGGLLLLLGLAAGLRAVRTRT